MISFFRKNSNKILKIIFIILCVIFMVPSVMYLLRKGTIAGFKNYYNFFINDGSYKTLSTLIYLAIFISLTGIYIYFIRKKDSFKNLKEILIYVGIITIFFVIMLPWTTSDIFYYMGVGELNSVYGQNPYYISIRGYCNWSPEVPKTDPIMAQGNINYWAKTTVVYGPIAQLVFTVLTKLSFKNIDVCIILFKLLNVAVHLFNCYLIFKITKKKKFVIMYGLNPFILLEFIANVHNDVIIVMFILLSLYFLLKKKQILPSVIFLAIATGMKYFTILLLPIVILYHFREEKNIWKRILRCIEYGCIFLLIMLLEYAVYFRDTKIFTAMMVQTERYSKSIYSGIYAYGKGHSIREVNLFGEIYTLTMAIKIFRNMMLATFAYIYIISCIQLLFNKEIKIHKALRRYNMNLYLFIFSLSNCQQWYLMWPFATLPWQKPNTMRNIIGISFASAIGNSIFMFKKEAYQYDIDFVVINFLVFLICMICTNRFKIRFNKKEKEKEKAK